MRTSVLALSTLAALLAAACTGGVTSNGVSDDGGLGGGGGGGGGNNEFTDAAICDQTVPITVTQTVKKPDMLLVVDKSGSMKDPLGGGTTSKMDVMKQAMATVLPGENANINFGLSTYPPDDACGAGQVISGIAPNNAANVVSLINAVLPKGSTPTHLSLDSARAYFGTIAVNPDGRYVLLATDGLPNCNGASDNPSNALTIAAAKALAQVGIKTFVIGFGDVAVADPAFLKQLAQAGGTTDFFAANSPQQLQQALTQISGTVTQASCSFELASAPQDPAKLGVTLDGTAVPRDPAHQTGWDYDPATNSITFYGATCASIQNGTGANVGVDYGCGSVIIE
jgi:hypothetical protein